MVNKIKKEQRLGAEKFNNKGCLMKIVEYNNADNIIVEFQDEYKIRVHAGYDRFVKGFIKNPYQPSVYGVGIVGVKYPVSINCKHTKEYTTWKSMLKRCFDEKTKIKKPSYKNVTCCSEWLYYENFYEWLHLQENFNKWCNKKNWALDKDILIKKNKIYSPKTCCLVPSNVNNLFTKCDTSRRNLPIGVKKNGNRFESRCENQLAKKEDYLGIYETINEAFQAYKKYKENLIKQIAQIEYNKGNITKQCYDAMMNYEVEITD